MRRALETEPKPPATAPAEGDYTLSLYDFVYRGGEDYFYRLVVHNGPHVDFIFPPSGVAGSSALYTVYGRNLPGGQPAELAIDGVPIEKLTVELAIPGDEAVHQLELCSRVAPSGSMLDAFNYRLANAKNQIPLYYALAPVVVEVEGNDGPAVAQTVTAPCEVVGQFYPARDVDVIQFEATKGEVYDIELFSHRLGVDVDPRFVIQRVTKDENGQESVSEIANVDDTGERNNRIGGDFDTSTDDPSYKFTSDQDATCRIILWDQFGGTDSDPRAVYRVAIRRPDQPDFRLAAVSQIPAKSGVVLMGSSSVRKGGTTILRVDAERRGGFDGDIEIVAEGLPQGVTTRGACIGSNQNSTMLILEAAEDAPQWAGTIRVLGKSRIGDRQVVRHARGGAVVWGTDNRELDPPEFRTTRDLALGVIAHEEAATWVEVGENKVWETSRGGKLEIPIKVKRRRGFGSDMNLISQGLPNAIKPPELLVPGSASEAKLALNITNKDAKSGNYSFFMQAHTEAQFIRKPEEFAKAQNVLSQVKAEVKQLEEEKKKALADQETAVEAVQEASRAVKRAEEAKTRAAQKAQQAAEVSTTGPDTDANSTVAAEKLNAAEHALVEARKELQAAETANADAEKKAAESGVQLDAAKEREKSADKRVRELKNSFNLVTISTPVRLRIVDSPIKLDVSATEYPVEQGEAKEVPVAIERLYGFAEKVDLVFEVPEDISGVAVNNVSVEKDQQMAKFEVTADDQATPGDHTITVRAHAKFNNIEVESTEQIVLKVARKGQPAQ